MSSSVYGQEDASVKRIIHRLVLWYTTSDDGVWVGCEKWGALGCGWEKNLGFNPTTGDVEEAVREHDRAQLAGPSHPGSGETHDGES